MTDPFIPCSWCGSNIWSRPTVNSDYCSRKCFFEHEEEKAVQVENARVSARQKQQKEAEEKRAWEALTHEQRSAYNAKIERQNAINRANRIAA